MFLPEDEISTVQGEGWIGIQNGELIRRAEDRFDILMLADKNLRYQQNLTGRRLALIELPTNRWPVLSQMRERIATRTRTSTSSTRTATAATAVPTTSSTASAAHCP